MVPTKSQILQMLSDARAADVSHEGWVVHSIGVGDAAGKIAASVNAAQHQTMLDPEQLIKLGYLHDIGKLFDYPEHPKKGYEYLKSLGFDDEYCEVCLTHSFVNNDPFCSFADFANPERDQFLIDYVQHHDFSLADKLVSLCDTLVCLKPYTIDKRMIDVISRHGVCARTPERIRETYKLKEHFDDLLGYNLYDLFPEIKDNL